MKALLDKLVDKILESIENAVVSAVYLHEIGLTHAETNYFLPMPYIGLWESYYFDGISRLKLMETAENE